MIRLLLVEDSTLDAAATRRALRGHNVEIHVATTLAAAREAARAGTWDVILSDHKLPDGEGLELVADGKGTPLVLVTGAGSELLAVAALKAGASDYVVKDVAGAYLKLLPATIDTALANARVQAELRHTHEELQNQLNKLRMINTELKAFASRVSHDVRAPLRRIRTFVDLIVQEAPHLSREVSQMMDILVRQVDELDTITRRLLEFSRGGGIVQVQPIDPSALFELVTRTLSVDIEEASATIAVGPLPAQILGDPPLLELVFQNLVGNAIKYRSKERPRIDIEHALEAGVHVFTLRDNGRGVDPGEASRLFEPFYRGSRTADVWGTGLGLSTCHRIIDAHGGSIRFAAVDGPGACVEVRLPAAGPGAPAGEL